MATAAVSVGVDDAPATVASSTSRWLALDLFRFVAVLLMVQGHVFSALLDSQFHSELWYRRHSFVHGYTAPMFLFGAGLAFGYTTFRKWDEHTRGGASALKRFKRYFWLLFIGYALHLPDSSLSRILAVDDPARLRDMFQVDVLQHIGVSLGLCQLLVLVVRRQKTFAMIAGGLGVAAIILAPWVWNVDLSSWPLPLAGYVNASTGSMFPLLPWAGFTYLGVAVAYVVGAGRAGSGAKRPVSDRLAWPLLGLALAAMVLPIVVNRIGSLPVPSEYYGVQDGVTQHLPRAFWKTSPLLTIWRLGNVMLVLAILCFVERGLSRWGLARRGAGTVGRGLDWARAISAESLVVYVVHLVILHGCVLMSGLRQHFGGPTLSFGATVGITLTMVLAMMLLAILWHELKRHPRTFSAVQWSLVSLFALVLLLPG